MNIYAMDLLNFGKSEGPFRGELVSLEESVEQANAFTQYLLQKNEEKVKIYLSGCSYGANIVLKMSVDSPQLYSGVVLISPAFR